MGYPMGWGGGKITSLIFPEKHRLSLARKESRGALQGERRPFTRKKNGQSHANVLSFGELRNGPGANDLRGRLSHGKKGNETIGPSDTTCGMVNWRGEEKGV